MKSGMKSDSTEIIIRKDMIEFSGTLNEIADLLKREENKYYLVKLETEKNVIYYEPTFCSQPEISHNGEKYIININYTPFVPMNIIHVCGYFKTHGNICFTSNYVMI